MDNDYECGMPWCEPCGGYHHKDAPGCFRFRRERRDDGDELFGVAGGQGRSDREVLDSGLWLGVLAVASVALAVAALALGIWGVLR